MGMMAWGAPAQAQASRTWVSGVGDDANPCSRTAPCKTFAGAISKTATGGEIDCLDPGGFGALTITKSITLDCGGGVGGQVGSVLVSGTNGFVINDGGAGTAVVKIRNMTLNGLSSSPSTPGLSGIKFLSGAALIVEHVGIFGFGGTAGSNAGVDFEPSKLARLYMTDVEIQYGLADGVLIKPQSGGIVAALLTRVSAFHNPNGSGLRVDSTNAPIGPGSTVTAVDSTFAGGSFGVFAVTPPSTGNARVSIVRCTMFTNSVGVSANGGTAVVTIGQSVVTSNSTGMSFANGAALQSFVDNYFSGNSSDGTSSLPNMTKL
ncbi:MAG: right-handed parallel beta-helix repeat-containing protein [Alphaproteobacteria bacterium]|nr:right-handed parallel beta-helix repeat-containing protein [Alphaproteobacteria bacterium]MBL6940373.1 right-handed parallel beta-helix repeat-containing protein [Alphaproteobacteria bacterium]MBL7099096.1 right-handed parallel beta-helix repeat-containing protein [Alphaproteobacteria bacterium]